MTQIHRWLRSDRCPAGLSWYSYSQLAVRADRHARVIRLLFDNALHYELR